ncbi:protein of unknown function [Candidatus Nitrospira inopinata]|uniref:Uncharacterized protein n=1 Tax=Candidatus Nitrospira inopinata TaxID=1715989 RepID=A0A0S4KWJ9_9BACT|nr:protein of unknown function [Candidatus Nitrospira inopinata]
MHTSRVLHFHTADRHLTYEAGARAGLNRKVKKEPSAFNRQPCSCGRRHEQAWFGRGERI